MKKQFLGTLVLVLLAGSASTQITSLKKNDRPVFLSVEDLAAQCADWYAINPGGHPPKPDDVLTATWQQIGRGMSCKYYILGYEDGRLEEDFARLHYHPVQSQLVT